MTATINLLLRRRRGSHGDRGDGVVGNHCLRSSVGGKGKRNTHEEADFFPQLIARLFSVAVTRAQRAQLLHRLDLFSQPVLSTWSPSSNPVRSRGIGHQERTPIPHGPCWDPSFGGLGQGLVKSTVMRRNDGEISQCSVSWQTQLRFCFT